MNIDNSTLNLIIFLDSFLLLLIVRDKKIKQEKNLTNYEDEIYYNHS
jgi:hypothetical protein